MFYTVEALEKTSVVTGAGAYKNIIVLFHWW